MDVDFEFKNSLLLRIEKQQQSLLVGDRSIAVPAEFFDMVLEPVYCFCGSGTIINYDRKVNVRAVVRRFKKDVSEHFGCHTLSLGAMKLSAYFLLRFRSPADLLVFMLLYGSVLKSMEL